MITDPELEQWSELFRSETVDPAQIAARAKQAVRNFRLWLYSEVAVTIVMGFGAIYWAWQSHQSSITLLAVWVWISLAAAWVFRLINDWNDFSGVAVATGSHLATLRRRLRSNRRAALFGGVLFFVQFLVTSAWVFRELTLPSSIVLAVGTVVFCAWLFLYLRKNKKELAELSKLQDEFAPESAAPPQPVAAVLVRAVNTVTRQLKKRLRVF